LERREIEPTAPYAGTAVSQLMLTTDVVLIVAAVRTILQKAAQESAFGSWIFQPRNKEPKHEEQFPEERDNK